MPRKCKDCIHISACEAWNVGDITNMDCTNCAIYETEKLCSMTDDAGDWICSNCGAELTDELNFVVRESNAHYCPNCGAIIKEWK